MIVGGKKYQSSDAHYSEKRIDETDGYTKRSATRRIAAGLLKNQKTPGLMGTKKKPTRPKTSRKGNFATVPIFPGIHKRLETVGLAQA